MGLGWVIKMMAKVWTSLNNKRPRGKKLYKVLGISSALIWVLALGSVFLLKDKKLSTAIIAKILHEQPIDSIKTKHEGKEDLFSTGKKDDHSKQLTKAEEISEAETGHGETSEHEPTVHGSEGHGTSVHGAEEHVSEGHGTNAHKTISHAAEEHSSTSHESVAHGNDSHKPEKHESQGHHAEKHIVTKGDLPSETEYDALKQVVELQVAAGKIEKAVAPLKRMLTIPTKDPELLTLATEVFLGVGRYEDALQTACEAIVLKPLDINLKVKAIEATYRLGNVAKAFEMAKATLKEHPHNLDLLIQTATMEIEVGKPFPDYGKTLVAAIKLDPNFPATLYLQGRKAQLEGNYRDAEIAFKNLLKQEPKHAKAHGQLGMALYHMGKNSEAQFEFESELAINPDDYNTWFNLGEIQLLSANNCEEASKIQALRAQSLKCFLKAIDLNPKHAQAHYRVGVIMNGNGQYKEAIKHLEAALKIDGTHVPTLVQLSLAYEYLKRPERAKECLTKAHELDPLNKIVLLKLKQWS